MNEKEQMNIHEKLMNIQCELNAPKNMYNSFGKYSYRSCESILEAVKPVAKKYGCCVTLSDDIMTEGDRTYVQAIAMITDIESKEDISVTAFAREPEVKKGMDESQITGTASSYARKYALNGLFCIDDNKDADTDENRVERESRYQKQQAQDDPKVGAQQVEQITELAKQAKVRTDTICETFRIGTLQDMTMSMWVEATKMLERTMKKGQ